ncbi:3'-5' ssDNA/RNA exonuclease TatD [Oceanimonas baumannii]|uniref:Hydrolase TatD n=1 Tax=Oceanimonas baumannii TaxID=129578 RepID=A0A235CFK2_9GAMM|nr:3'-5' ssDNA/RNA exonuclease TatD [Oceanimonas baumannii]OYD23408.1 hydrolase TatD [Oceanimonas baumannii]TDW58436.1 TatD DNase family protein [Oceanimonas baumannii]
MIDIGVNLTSSQFDKDRAAVLERAQAAGITGLVLTGTSLAESRSVAELAASRPGFCYATAGVHPHNASTFDDATLGELRMLAAQPEVVAIGECGLDFNRDFSPRPQQEAAFDAQLALAAELQLPVFMHCRDAHERFMAILAPWRDKLSAAVLHCFTGSEDELKDCLALDLHIGITGWICDERRGAELQRLVSLIPAERLMIETDSPYLIPRDLSPKPASRRNEPAYLSHIAGRIATCRGEDAVRLIAATTATSRAFFQLQE